MLKLFEEEGYTKKQIQRMAWNSRKIGFPAMAKFLLEVAQLIKEEHAP